jgi:hypothetical protein
MVDHKGTTLPDGERTRVNHGRERCEGRGKGGGREWRRGLEGTTVHRAVMTVMNEEEQVSLEIPICGGIGREAFVSQMVVV